MARMIPDRVADKVPSAAERKLFERFRSELPADWTVLHSLGISTHATKPWAEIDFVIVSQHGVCCIEVKGGRVSRTGGKWIFTDRFGNDHPDHEGPFAQVAGAATALHQFIERSSVTDRRIRVAYGVAMPDVVFDVTGPDVEPEVLLDQRDVGVSVENYIRRVWKHWARKRGYAGRGPEPPLPRESIASVVALLRGDFDRVPTLGARMDEARGELAALTEEQYRVLDEVADNPRMIVLGGAGTGKTMLAAEEARRRNAAGDRVLMVCFNKYLAEVLRAAVPESPTLHVVNLHGWLADLVREAGLESRLPRAEPEDLFGVFYPELGLEALFALDRCERYDTLILDEAQDLLRPAYLDIFDAALRGGLSKGRWMSFYDPRQDLFDGTARLAIERLKPNAAFHRLTVNCRNTKPIALHTFLLSQVEPPTTARIEGPKVEVHWYRDADHQVSLFEDAVAARFRNGLRARDAVVLGPRRLEGSRIRRSRVPAGMSLEAADPVKPRDGTLCYATIASFKGLEADSVFLVDIDDLEGDDNRFLAYVGASRARVCLDVFLSTNTKARYQENATKLFAGRRAGAG